MPVPVLAAAAELLAERLDGPDPAAREVTGAVHARLLAAFEDAVIRLNEVDGVSPRLDHSRSPAGIT